MNPKEQVRGARMTGPDMARLYTDGRAFTGRATIASGSALVTVSTANIRSTSLFRSLVSIPSSLGVAANSGGGICVRSVVHMVSFAIARPTGVAVPWDEQVHWELLQTTSY